MSLLCLGAWASITLHIFADCLFGGQPIVADFDSLNLAATYKAAYPGRSESTELRGFRHGDQVRREVA